MLRYAVLCCVRQAGVHWTRALTAKINRSTKLVGTTINCGGITVDGVTRQNPHVQSMLFATDQVRGGMRERGRVGVERLRWHPCCL